MEGFVKFVQMLNTNVFSKPEFVVAIFAMVGCAVMKRKWYDSLVSFVKVIVGYYMLSVGSSGITSTFRPIISAMNAKFGLNAAVVDQYFMSGFIYGETTGIAQVPNFVALYIVSLVTIYLVNFVLVLFSRVTKLRSLYVRSLYNGCLGEVLFILLLVPAWRDVPHCILIGIMIGVRLTVLANLSIEPTKKVTGDSGLSIGHWQMLGIWLTSKIAPKLGDPDDSVENTPLPGWMSIFNDTSVSTALLMTVFFGAIMLICGKETMMEFDSSLKPAQWYPTYILSKTLYFSVYINILVAGVRMFTNELVQSFKGISENRLPGATIAVDIAVIYGFASPNVMMIGFFAGFFGQLLAIASLIFLKSPILCLTGFVPVFFDNAGIAVYANKYGGKKAAIILPFICGMIQIWGAALILIYLANHGIVPNAYQGNFDAITINSVSMLSISELGVIGCVAFTLLMLVIPQLQYRANKEEYFKVGNED